MMSQNPIDTLFETSNLAICVTSKTAVAHNPHSNVAVSRWTCDIVRADAAGAPLQVYTPFNKKDLYLPWSSILSITPATNP